MMCCQFFHSSSDNLMDSYPHYALFADIKDGAGIAINFVSCRLDFFTLNSSIIFVINIDICS